MKDVPATGPILLRCNRCGAELSEGGVCPACMLDRGWMEEDKDAPLGFSLPSFGDYEILQEIARGGMGVVYKARQRSLNRTVAVKMVLSGKFAKQSELQRFRAEAETAARLQHPNIVAIHEVGEFEGQPFFSMDYVEGKNLAEIANNQPLPAKRAAAYLKTIAEAVEYAHSNGVLHRDLKPSNILIDQNDQPRITDFGLAKRFSSDSDLAPLTSDLTLTGQVLGSPNFMPPEQAMGDRRSVGPASDVYSLGAILYQLLAGRPPFMAETLTQTLRLVAETEPVSPRLLNPSVPRDLETICLKCMHKATPRRYSSARALAEDLGCFLRGEPIHARPVAQPEKAWRWCRRKPALASAILLLLILAIGSLLVALWINRERLAAERARQSEAELRKQAEANEKKAIIEAAKSQHVAELLQRLNVSHPAKPLNLAEMLQIYTELLTAESPKQPQTATLQLGRAHVLGRLGRWKEAVADLASVVEFNPSDPWTSNLLMPLLVASGDLEGYRRHCQRIQARFRGASDPEVAEQFAKDCSILPSSGADPVIVSEWADNAAAHANGHQFGQYFRFAKGFAEYRQSHFTNAVEWLAQASTSSFPNPSAQAWFVLAMARHHLGHPEAARAALAQGKGVVARRLPAAESGDVGTSWYDWVNTHALMSEAMALIEGEQRPLAEVLRVGK